MAYICLIYTDSCIRWCYDGYDADLEISNWKYPFQKTDIHIFNFTHSYYCDTLEDVYQGDFLTRLETGFVKIWTLSWNYIFESSEIWAP